MARWYVPTPSPYVSHPATWHQPLHLHLAPMWSELRVCLGALHGRVLDVGAGSQPYRSIVGPGVTEYVTFDQAGMRDVTHHGDAHRLPFADQGFDAVVAFQVLEHCERPGEVLREMFRVAVPGGALVVTVPSVWPDHELPRDFWRFTRPGLTALALEAGWESPTVTSLGGFWSALGQMAALELQHHALGRAVIPVMNVVARRADATARQPLALNLLLRATRPR